MTPYGDRELGQHRLRQWLVAWWHQAITWTNVDLSSVRSCGFHVRAISLEMPQSSITKICLKITCLKFHSNFPGANELMDSCDLFTYSSGLLYWHWGNHMIAPVSVKQPWWIRVKSAIIKPRAQQCLQTFCCPTGNLTIHEPEKM